MTIKVFKCEATLRCDTLPHAAISHTSLCVSIVECCTARIPARSAVMCLNMPNLEAKVEEREILADKLEKTRSRELAQGKQIDHRCVDTFAKDRDALQRKGPADGSRAEIHGRRFAALGGGGGKQSWEGRSLEYVRFDRTAISPASYMDARVVMFDADVSCRAACTMRALSDPMVPDKQPVTSVDRPHVLTRNSATRAVREAFAVVLASSTSPRA